jgi:hypothetical protein
MARKITNSNPVLHGRIPQHVVVKRVSSDLDADYDSGLWMGLRHDHSDLFDWLFEKNIELKFEKLNMASTYQQLLIVTALFEKRTDLMECLMKFDLPK